MKRLFQTVMLLFLGLAHGLNAEAQRSAFRTQSGTLMLAATWNGQPVTGASNRLHMTLNYESAAIELHFPLASLTTKNDSLNALMQAAPSEARFGGKMSIGFIQTKAHPRQNISVQGILTINGVSRPFQFNATLEHFSGSNDVCMLSAAFPVNLRDFGLSLPPDEGLVHARFNEVVLKKASD